MKSIAFFLILSMSLSAWAQSSVDIQSMQTRVYLAPERVVLRAVISVFQNNKYESIASDVNVGLVQAVLPSSSINESESTVATRAGVNIALGLLGVPVYVDGAQSGFVTRSVQVSTEEVAQSKTSVRLVLKESRTITTSQFFGAPREDKSESALLDRPDLYQSLFSQIDKEVFLRMARTSPAEMPKLERSVGVDKLTVLRDKLNNLNSLLTQKLITEVEFSDKKKALIDGF